MNNKPHHKSIDKSLLHKNIETYLVDLLIIISVYLIPEFPLDSSAYVILFLVAYIILVVSKKRPTNFFLVIIYVLAVIFPIAGLFGVQTMFFDLSLSNLSILSKAVIVFAVIIFMLFFINFKKKNKAYDILQTYIMPVLYTILFLATVFITEKYSDSLLLILIVYIPFRFLLIYSEPVKWYQFILIPFSLYTAFTSFNSDVETPIKAISYGAQHIDVKFSYSKNGFFEDATIIKVHAKPEYLFHGFSEGDFFIAVSDTCKHFWRIDKGKTIRYYKHNNLYGFSDSIKLVKLFRQIKDAQQYQVYADNKMLKYPHYSEIDIAEGYCDSTLVAIEHREFDKALEYNILAEQNNEYNNKIYYYRALIYKEQNMPQDSIYINLHDAIMLYNLDALAYCREYFNEQIEK